MVLFLVMEIDMKSKMEKLQKYLDFQLKEKKTSFLHHHLEVTASLIMVSS